MPNPYDDYGEYGATGWRAGEDRERWRERGDRDRWTGEGEGRRSHSGREPWRSSERWGGSHASEREGWSPSGGEYRHPDRGSWERGESYRGQPYRGDSYRGGWDRGGWERGERDPRVARDTLEGGDLGWHGGVKGAEGGGGYGGGFFGTAYSLYAGRPERVEGEGHPLHREDEERRFGRGPKNFRRSDERIQDELCERIARSGLDADDVEVKVENGEVTLTGTVRRREDKWRLESLCDSVYGVDDVHNQLRSADRANRSRDDITRTH